jgi:hypothetical protein
MCTFESNKVPGYRLVVAALMMYSLNAPSTIAQRWINEKEMLQTKPAVEAAGLVQ